MAQAAATPKDEGETVEVPRSLLERCRRLTEEADRLRESADGQERKAQRCCGALADCQQSQADARRRTIWLSVGVGILGAATVGATTWGVVQSTGQ